MKKKEIEICGKKVWLGYCYATELAFVKNTGKGLEKFDGNDPGDVVYLILASMLSVTEYEKRELDVTMDQLMYDATPTELVEALKVVMELRVDWYRVPEEDGKEKASEDGEKN